VDFWPHNTALYVTDFHENNPRFVFYFLRSIDFSRHNSGGAQQSLNRNFISPISIALPPTIREQEAIAEALSDADAHIESLEQLIAKKRQIKQGAMQELLTGNRRLPGFSGQWKPKRFSDLASIRNAKTMPSHVAPATPCVELDQIGQADGRLLGWANAGESVSSKYRFKTGDVLFGRLRSYLRKYWLADRDGLCSTEIWPLASNPQQSVSGFVHAIVQSDRFIEAACISYGTHMPRADWAVIRNLEITVPNPPEQSAIAAILRDMDAEITALEDRLAKARDIKQGMMQELLTGRVRLV
jgi:type I restriction enzyme S subunit